MMMMSQAAARNPINVVIVEDDNVTRKVLSAAIQSEPALQLVGSFDSVAPALEWLESTPVDLLLTDLALPDGSGIEIIRACVGHWPQCGIMVITMSSDEDSVLACIEAGAAGYLLKEAGRVDIVRALMDLHSGGSPISPIIARKVLCRMRDAMPPSNQLAADDGEPALEKQRDRKATHDVPPHPDADANLGVTKGLNTRGRCADARDDEQQHRDRKGCEQRLRKAHGWHFRASGEVMSAPAKIVASPIAIRPSRRCSSFRTISSCARCGASPSRTHQRG